MKFHRVIQSLTRHREFLVRETRTRLVEARDLVDEPQGKGAGNHRNQDLYARKILDADPPLVEIGGAHQRPADQQDGEQTQRPDPDAAPSLGLCPENHCPWSLH